MAFNIFLGVSRLGNVDIKTKKKKDLNVGLNGGNMSCHSSDCQLLFFKQLELSSAQSKMNFRIV
jgi:hypothetical protein